VHCQPIPFPVSHPGPQLALVVGSGGVKSAAALGLAQALHEQGLRPDLVVGCSAGAVFGALIARGDEHHHAVEIATRLWTREITGRRRWGAMAALAAPGLCGFDEHFALRDDGLILQRLRAAFGDQRLEELPTPLRVMACDARTGQAVVLRSGRIVDALRATVALPMLFAPWPVQGQLLMDGSVSDPLPVQVAQDAQATVALGFECPMPKQVNRPARLVARSFSALTNSLLHARLAASDPRSCHVLLMKPAQRVGLFDTHQMPALIHQGYEQGKSLADGLARQLGLRPCAPGLSLAA
jgi:NTE family protein